VIHFVGAVAVHCPCGEKDSDDMIGCDGKSCQVRWYHFKCVNVDPSSIPDGEWLCSECITSMFYCVYFIVKRSK